MQKMLLLLVAFFATSVYAAVSDADIARNLDSAKANRSELEKVLSYFQQKREPQQLEAARFLIGNMDQHYYVEVALYDSNKVEHPFDVMSFENFKVAAAALDSLSAKYPGLDYRKKQRLNDLETIKADYLIENIELAFAAWKLPWARSIRFEQFLEYILPYRGSNEPIEPWRREFFDKFKSIATTMKDSTDPVEAACIVNRDITSWYGFDERYYLHPTDLGLAEMKRTRKGRCEDMTNLTIYAMRAAGVAVTSDYTPYWANTGNNHAWNAIIDRDGAAIPFMGCEADPRTYRLSNRAAKVYRKMYSRQAGSLSAAVKGTPEKTPNWLSGERYSDVSTEYGFTRQIKLILTSTPPDSTQMAYLCIFNSGSWEPVEWSKRESKGTTSHVTFNDVNDTIVYMPGFYVNGKIQAAGAPFLQYSPVMEQPDGKKLIGGMQSFLIGSKKNITLELLSTTRKVIEFATEGKRIAKLDSGEVYELYWWSGDSSSMHSNGGWVSLGAQRAQKGQPLVYTNIPENRLYWLIKRPASAILEGIDGQAADIRASRPCAVPEAGQLRTKPLSDEERTNHEERVFTYQNGMQVWW